MNTRNSRRDYPTWICADCGRKWGRRIPTHEITMHEGVCDCAGRKLS